MSPRKLAQKKDTKTKAVVEEPVLRIKGADDSDSALAEENDITASGSGKEKYYETVGRRKTATARVRLYTKKSSDEDAAEGQALVWIKVKDKNMADRPYFEYFKDKELQSIVESPLKKLKSVNRFKATALVSGGGINGQAEAVRHGLARALVLFDENFSKKLKKASYLTRDPRAKERRKPGLKKARKSPRWSKR